ncbi:MAG: ABC transporter permease, partial [Deltaproteobacteria bacterium]|nr:ABC transporter permease [Deltaproteobacteria bacterium]
YLHIARDRITILMVIFFPVFILLLFGYAINLDIKHIPLAVYDQDRSVDSRELTESFIQSGYFDLKDRFFSEKQINPSVDNREVKVVLRIPPNFSQDIHKEKSCPVQIIIDGSDNNTATITMGYSKAIIQKFSRRILGELLLNKGLAISGQLPSIDLRPNIWYNPELKSSIFLIPGLIGIILMAIAVIMTSITIVREKERGTMESLLVTPIRPIELMIGKITPYVVICFVSLVLIVFLSRPIFNLPFRGSLLTLLCLSTIFIAASLGIGLYISNIADTTQTAWLLGFLSSLLPAMLLSGFIFPIESMPFPIQLVTYFLPIRYFLVILRGIILKGVGITILYPEALILVIFALATITISTLQFKKKIG